MRGEDRQRAALHEAGHALIAHCLGRIVHELSLDPPALRYGWKTRPPTGRPKTPAQIANLEGELMIALAGIAAERCTKLASPKGSLLAAADDLARASELGLRLSGPARAEATVGHFLSVVERMLDKRQEALHRVAAALTASGRLDGPALSAAIG